MLIITNFPPSLKDFHGTAMMVTGGPKGLHTKEGAQTYKLRKTSTSQQDPSCTTSFTTLALPSKLDHNVLIDIILALNIAYISSYTE